MSTLFMLGKAIQSLCLQDFKTAQELMFLCATIINQLDMCARYECVYVNVKKTETEVGCQRSRQLATYWI